MQIELLNKIKDTKDQTSASSGLSEREPRQAT
jgi:hypothetical protein